MVTGKAGAGCLWNNLAALWWSGVSGSGIYVLGGPHFQYSAHSIADYHPAAAEKIANPSIAKYASQDPRTGLLPAPGFWLYGN